MSEVQKTEMPANLDGFIGSIMKNATKMAELYEIVLGSSIVKDKMIKERDKTIEDLNAKILELEKKE